MKIAIYGSRRQHDNGDRVRRLVLELVMGGASVSMHEKLYDHLTCELGLSLPGVSRVCICPDDAVIAVSIGGDGTFLRTVAWVECRRIPILGINTGHLGYLTALTLDEALEGVDRILAVDFRADAHTMLHVECDRLLGWTMALNEAVIAKEDSASMVSATVHIDGHFLADYKADGLIVSTPTGSTAYNLSVGGPIVQPSAPVWVLSPIAAHSLTVRPLVVGDDAEVVVTVGGRGSRFRLVLDGRAASLPMGTTLTIRRASQQVTILQRRDRDFAKIIGTKLMFNG